MQPYTQDSLPLLRRFALALALLLVTIAFRALILGQAPEGTVTGICTDAETGKPLSGALVSLSRQDSSSSEDHWKPSPPTPEWEMPDSVGAPTGWSEGAEDDSSVDVEGKKSLSPDYRAIRTDSRGRFAFSHVRAGDYRLSAGGATHDSQDMELVVVDTRVVRRNFQLERSDSGLDFESESQVWAPGEIPDLRLHGLLRDPEATLLLERLDVNGMVQRDPSFFTGGLGYGYNNPEPSPWPGQFTLLRRWVQRLAHPEDQGHFHQHISLGKLPPGVYRVTARSLKDHPQVEAKTWLQVTHLALVYKSCGNQVVAMVADLAAGRPAAGIPVRLYDQLRTGEWYGNSSSTSFARHHPVLTSFAAAVAGRHPSPHRPAPHPAARPTFASPLQVLHTSPAGLAWLSTKGAPPESEAFLLAQEGDSVAALKLEANSRGGETASGSQSPELRSFVYTERPVYRPGQTVYLKGISRWFRNTSGFSLPARQLVKLDVRDFQETLVSHQELQTNEMGSWHTSLDLSEETVTGEYSVGVEIAGQTATGSFKVAAYQKPQFQVSAAFNKDRYVRGDTIDATVTAFYYFGAPVSGGRLHYVVNRSDAGDGDSIGRFEPTMKKDENEDHYSRNSGEPELEGDLKLDTSGQAHISIPTRGRSEFEEDQTYTLNADVEDISYHSEEGHGSVLVAQGEFSLALSANPGVCSPGSQIAVAVKASKSSGGPLAGQGITLEYGYRSWRGESENYSRERALPLSTSSTGAASITIKAARVGLLSLRASAEDGRGNHISSETDVWVSGEDEDIPVPRSDLSVTLDRKSYHVGQTAHLLVNAEHSGPEVLVTVEGSSLYRVWIMPLRRKSLSVDVPVTADLVPGVTVSACCVFNKQFLQSSTKLQVQDQRRRLHITVEADRQSYHPGDKATLKVHTSDAAGHPVPAEVSVGVVDKAIYAIQEDSGSIVDAFQPEQSNNVSTGDSCERIYYGDVDKGAAGVKVRRKFKDTAFWAPEIHTGQDGAAVLHFQFPDNLTTWRVTCVGHTRDTAVGKGTCSLLVKKDLVVRLEAPPFLVAGDRSILVAVLHNNSSSVQHCQFTISASGLDLEGEKSLHADLPPGEPVRFSWPIIALSVGPATIQAAATARVLSDALEQELPVLPHGAYQDTWQAGTVHDHLSTQVTLDPGAMPGLTAVNIRLSPTVCSALLPAADYLAEYPYGSTDSTVSTLLSDAVLARASTSKDGGLPALPLDPAKKQQLSEMVRRCLQRLYRFQHYDGGWGWWQPDKSELWMTSYATWVIHLAAEAGFQFNPRWLGEAGSQLGKLSNEKRQNWTRYDRPSTMAMAALALARAGYPANATFDLQFLQDLWKKDPSSETYEDLAMAALAAHSCGSTISPSAADLMKQLWAGRRPMGSLAAWPRSPHLPSQGRAQALPDVDATAWALLAAEAITPNDPGIDGVARWLMVNRNGDHWSSTRTTAIAIMGLSSYLAHSRELQPNFNARLLCNGSLVKEVHFGPSSIYQPDLLVRIPDASLHPGKNIIVLDKLAPSHTESEDLNAQGAGPHSRLTPSNPLNSPQNSGANPQSKTPPNGGPHGPAPVTPPSIEGLGGPIHHLSDFHQNWGVGGATVQGRLYYSLNLRQCMAQGKARPPAPSWASFINRLTHPENTSLPFTPSGFRVKRVYMRLTSRRGFLWEDTVPDPESHYNAGDSILVRLIIDNIRPASHLMVEEPIPAGCRIGEVSGAQEASWDNWWDYTDVRDDRVVFFIGDLTRGEHEIDYHLQARTTGAYDVMPTLITGTFDPTLHALGASSRLWVDAGGG